MKTLLAQVKFKTADFSFNFKEVIKYAQNCDCDLIVFPSFENLGEKDLIYDERYQSEIENFYSQLAAKRYPCAILIGDVLIRNGDIQVSDDGFYEIGGVNLYVDEIFRDDVVCDLMDYVVNAPNIADTRFWMWQDYDGFLEIYPTSEREKYER